MAELIAAMIILAAAAALGLSFRRASRRTRDDLEQARRRHRDAMAAFLASGDGRAQAPDRDGWAVVQGEQGKLALRLTAGADLKRNTFIRYATQLHVKPLDQEQAFRAPLQGVELDYGKPGPGAQALMQAGLPDPLVQELVQLTTAMHVQRGRLLLLARSGGEVTHHYSYGLHLLVQQDGLERLWTLGQALGDHLLE